MREGSFDDVPALVSRLIKRVEMLSRRILFDHRRGAASGEKRAEGVAVVGRVAQQGLRWRQRFDQFGRRFDVVAIAAGQFERDDAAVSIDDSVDFRGSPAPASANGLFLGPPFPPAAQRWALAVVLSMH
jgi:hypothetical protein